MMLDHLKTYFSTESNVPSDCGFKLNMINRRRLFRLLKTEMKFSYRKVDQRAPRSQDLDNLEKKMQFPRVMELIAYLGYNIVYVDECTIAPSQMSTYTWAKIGKHSPQIRASDNRISIIGAYILKGKYAFMMRRGTNTAYHVMMFFDLLDDLLKDTFSDNYAQFTIFMVDNAAYHTGYRFQSYARDKKLSVMTLPKYCPEFNKIEGIFNVIKMELKKTNMNVGKLEHTVAQVLTNLK